jgi:hypothetical protein
MMIRYENRHGDGLAEAPSELPIGHLEGMLDPVMEWVRTGRADRRLERTG